MIQQLKDHKMIAQGGQAEIFEVNEKQVLRVLRNPEDENLLKNEMMTMQLLKEQGLCVPEVFEYLEIDGRPALLVERIYGVSLLDRLKKKPFDIFSLANKLAEIQISIGKYEAPSCFISAKKRAYYLIDRSELFDQACKNFLFTLIEQVPDGGSLCHGDFHPGNILVSEEKYFILDWFGVTKGDITADIAHSYLLMKTVPRLPTMRSIDHYLMKKTGSFLSHKYLKHIKKNQIQFDDDLFSKWMAIKAAERIVFGNCFERNELLNFIDKCHSMWLIKKNNLNWYKFI